MRDERTVACAARLTLHGVRSAAAALLRVTPRRSRARGCPRATRRRRSLRRGGRPPDALPAGVQAAARRARAFLQLTLCCASRERRAQRIRRAERRVESRAAHRVAARRDRGHGPRRGRSGRRVFGGDRRANASGLDALAVRKPRARRGRAARGLCTECVGSAAARVSRLSFSRDPFIRVLCIHCTVHSRGAPPHCTQDLALDDDALLPKTELLQPDGGASEQRPAANAVAGEWLPHVSQSHVQVLALLLACAALALLCYAFTLDSIASCSHVRILQHTVCSMFAVRCSVCAASSTDDCTRATRFSSSSFSLLRMCVASSTYMQYLSSTLYTSVQYRYSPLVHNRSSCWRSRAAGWCTRRRCAFARSSKTTGRAASSALSSSCRSAYYTSITVQYYTTRAMFDCCCSHFTTFVLVKRL